MNPTTNNFSEKPRWQSYLLLHLTLLLYAVGSVFAKYAGLSNDFWKTILFLALEFAMLGAYALLWQLILKNTPLTTAYANRAICVVWSYLFGFLLFGETLTLGKGIGIILVIVGILVLVTTDD